MSNPGLPVFEIGEPVSGSHRDEHAPSGVTFANAEPSPLPRDPVREALIKGQVVDARLHSPFWVDATANGSRTDHTHFEWRV